MRQGISFCKFFFIFQHNLVPCTCFSCISLFDEHLSPATYLFTCGKKSHDGFVYSILGPKLENCVIEALPRAQNVINPTQ